MIISTIIYIAIKISIFMKYLLKTDCSSMLILIPFCLNKLVSLTHTHTEPEKKIHQHLRDDFNRVCGDDR